MSVRTELLLRLRQEVFGPRKFCYEVLSQEQDPRNEFITGVIIPKDVSDEEAKEIEGEAETLGTGIDNYGDDDSDEESPVVAAAPVLDPKSQPRSMGISFVIRAKDEQEPHIANINHYHSRSGYYRDHAGTSTPSPKTHIKRVNPLLPPDLILQFEYINVWYRR